MIPECSVGRGASNSFAVERVLARLIAADNVGDIAAVLDCYADDAIWLPPVGPPVIGKAEIAHRYEAMFNEFEAEITLEISESHVSQDLAVLRGVTRGVLKSRHGARTIDISDKFIAIARLIADRWRLSHLMWSPLTVERT